VRSGGTNAGAGGVRLAVDISVVAQTKYARAGARPVGRHGPGRGRRRDPAGAQRVLDAVEEFLTGTRPAPETERVLATVLFTDIVGSTERATQLGDRRWRELLDDHDAGFRRELARWGGEEVKHMGDGFFATFDGPARAVRCAASVAAATGRLGLPIRVGVHTGECERDQDDLLGIAVHIGARTCALAQPGEVLVSSTVKDLVVGSELRFADRGEHALKGVQDRWHLYAVER
jgi:class 3 adenylate cyclase